jgi:hypothetical protein
MRAALRLAYPSPLSPVWAETPKHRARRTFRCFVSLASATPGFRNALSGMPLTVAAALPVGPGFAMAVGAERGGGRVEQSPFAIGEYRGARGVRVRPGIAISVTSGYEP